MDLYIILGYLGSGKTTFVKNMLSHFSDKNNAVIVNDFGGRDVDGFILKEFTKNLQSIYDGSIFCSCKSDKFAAAVIKLSQNDPDNIIVEASGLANPFTMLNVLDIIRNKSGKKIDLRGVICLADAVNFEKMLSVCNAVRMQAASSDVILINKTDLADANTVNRVKGILREINGGALVITTADSYIPDYNFKIAEKRLPPNINDLTVQKMQVDITKGVSLPQLNGLCGKLSRYCHRIKGLVSINGEPCVYEYIDGKGKAAAAGESGNYLVLLSCMGENLAGKVRDIIKDYDFAGVKQ